jgi:hypothetical protein
MFRSIFIALCLAMLTFSCGGEDGVDETPGGIDVWGNYDFAADETENTCNPDGPRGEFAMPLETWVSHDGNGQVSLWGGGLWWSMPLVSKDGVHTLALDKGDCLWEDWFGGLSSTSCVDEGVALTFNGTYDDGLLWISGDLQLDYTASCGENGDAAGYNKILLEGGQEPWAYMCRETAFYCYTGDSCTGLLPGCVSKTEDCHSVAKSTRQGVAGECKPVEVSSTTQALTLAGKNNLLWNAENFDPRWHLISPAWLTHKRFEAYFNSLK